MIHRWEVRAEQYGDRWAARWQTSDGRVSGHVGPEFATAEEARGHAFMWIARYEDALAAPTAPDVVTEARVPTDDELAEALTAYRSQFGGDDVTLGGA